MMWQHSSAWKFCKVMNPRFQRLCSILRVQRSFQLVLIKLPKYGMLKLDLFSRCLKVTKIKFSLVNSTMKEIPLLLDPRTIHVKFGEILTLLEKMVRKKVRLSPLGRLMPKFKRLPTIIDLFYSIKVLLII